MSRSAPRVVVVGCGYWGRNLVRNFAELGALVAVADTMPGRAEEIAATHGVRAVTFATALHDPDVDAVVLATPAESHATMALEALAAGKHVLVEKPLALRVEDGERVARAAAAAGRIVMVGHLLQYHPAFLKLAELVRSGELGRLRYIYSNRLNLGRIRREENVFWSFAPHDISMILALVGEQPEKVEAVARPYLHAQIADVTTTHLTFANGVAAHVFVSWLHPVKEQKLVVVGDGGMAMFDDGEPWERKLTLFRHRIDWRDGLPQPSKAEPEPVPVAPAEPLRLECAHFLDCVAHGRRPRTDVVEGLAVLGVLAAAAPAAAPTGKPELPAGVHESAYVDPGCSIGEGTRIWHFSHVQAGARIGRDCVLGQNVLVGPEVSIGDGCKIQNNVSLYQGVVLEDGVFCGPSCVFTNVLNPRAEVDRRREFRPTVVRRGTTICANATIVCGHELGTYSFIAAGAVVTRDVPAFALVAGVPARRIGWVGHAGERLGDDLVCPRTGRRYLEVGPERLVEIVEPPAAEDRPALAGAASA